VRYFAALLRGVNFANRATVMITKAGLVISVEEARTLLATAYINSDIFDEYTYTPSHSRSTPSPPLSPTDSDPEDASHEDENAAFEIPLNTLIECLNIFGTAGAVSNPNITNGSAGGGKPRKWRRADDDGSEEERERGRDGRRGALDNYFGSGGKDDKRTGMRMSFAGAGYPLTLLVAEDSTGPTTTCEITTFDPEPNIELPFDSESTVLKIILKSSWLRDALSELDPSCDKLTIIGNPPTAHPSGTTGGAKPMLRIQAAGTFGSTEMDYPNDKEVLESFTCTHTVAFSYHTVHIARTARALASSTKTSLRIDEEGLLSLQFLMPSPVGGGGKKMSEAFIEFRCLALDSDV